MLRTAAEGYKVLQLNGQSWPAIEAFYRMTLGNARALSLDDRIGSIEAGKEADLIALDPRSTPALAHRMETAGGDLEVELFALLTLGDDRAVRQTYVAGEPRKGKVAPALRALRDAGDAVELEVLAQSVTGPLCERQPFIPPAKCLTSSRPIARALFSALRDRPPD